MEISGVVRFRVLNDMYSYIGVPSLHGGFSRAVTLMTRPSSSTPHTFLVCCGDFLGGSKIAEATKGVLPAKLLNVLNPHICVLGNHEFDYGPDKLAELLEHYCNGYPWLAANVRMKQDNQYFPGTVPYVVKSISFPTAEENAFTVRIGFFGVCTPSTVYTSFPGDNVVFENPVEVGKAMVRLLKEEEKVDFIVAVTHLSIEEDKKVALEVDGIDLILGGHDHQPFGFVHNGVLIFKCGQNGYWVGTVDVSIVATKRENEPLQVQVFPSWSMESTFGVEPDAQCEDIVRETLHQPSDQLSIPREFQVRLLGDLDMRTSRVRTQSCSGGNLVADAMKHHFKAQGVDIALINGGFIRGDRLYRKATTLNRTHLEEELPFPRQSVLLRITGKLIRLALEQHLRLLPSAMGVFPHVSEGVRVEYQESRDPFDRVCGVWIDKNGVWESLVESSEYLVCVSEFLSMGGDDCWAWSEGIEVCRSVCSILDLVMCMLEEASEYHPDDTIRIASLQ